MSVAVEPGETCEFVLDRHKGLPEDKRPAFIVSAMSRRIRRKWQAVAAKAIAIKKRINDEPDFEKKIPIIEEVQAVYDEMIRMGVVAWKNIAVDFTPETLQAYLNDVLDDEDCEELAFDWPAAFAIAEDQQKKSLSPSASATAHSEPVATAPAASA